MARHDRRRSPSPSGGSEAVSEETPGVRVQPRADGYLDPNMPLASYGRPTAARVQGTRSGWWQVRAPDGSGGSLNPEVHTIDEHEDGTITVRPSLDYSQRKPGAWHGWLTRGIFRSV